MIAATRCPASRHFSRAPLHFAHFCAKSTVSLWSIVSAWNTQRSQEKHLFAVKQSHPGYLFMRMMHGILRLGNYDCEKGLPSLDFTTADTSCRRYQPVLLWVSVFSCFVLCPFWSTQTSWKTWKPVTSSLPCLFSVCTEEGAGSDGWGPVPTPIPDFWCGCMMFYLTWNWPWPNSNANATPKDTGFWDIHFLHQICGVRRSLGVVLGLWHRGRHLQTLTKGQSYEGFFPCRDPKFWEIGPWCKIFFKRPIHTGDELSKRIAIEMYDFPLN